MRSSLQDLCNVQAKNLAMGGGVKIRKIPFYSLNEQFFGLSAILAKLACI